MAKEYLDKTGLAYFWSKIKSYVIKENTRIPFAQVDSTSTSKVYTVTVPEITELTDGVCLYLMNGVVTSESGFTVEVNDLGALPVYSTLSAASRATTLFNINYTLLLVYNSKRVTGGCWDVYYGYDSNTNTIGYQLRTNSQSMPMKSVTYRYRLLFTASDHAHYVPANNSSSTNATASRTVCQDKIDPFGNIYYYGTTASVASGSRPSATYLWSQYAISLGYSFNRTGAALTLTSWHPVYVKCTPQSDGSAIIDSTEPYTQTLPSTEDGYIYIFLGVAYSATNVELTPQHPVYWYKNGMIRPYTNVDVPTKTSDLTNDSGFITDAGVTSFNGSTGAVTYTAPVTSVNGDTGDVSLSIPTHTSNLINDSGYISTGDFDDKMATPSFYAADSTSQAVLSQAFGASAEIKVPSDFTTMLFLLAALEPRRWFAWMNGTELEFARLSISVNTSNSAITLYLRGRTSIATGIMGVDSSWTITPLASDAEGVAY